MHFADRTDAGRRLADELRSLRIENATVLALPRGGVPVAFEVARALSAPLDVLVVRKIGAPSQPELAMGALGEDGVIVVDETIVRRLDVSPRAFEEIVVRERSELDRRARRYRGNRAPVSVSGRTAVVVDDGIATGSTARAACRAARARGASRVLLAAPVAPSDISSRMRPDADDVVCVHTPAHFRAVGQFYADFSQTSDEQVVDLLRRVSTVRGAPVDREVSLPVTGVSLPGRLTVSADATAVVVFVHGSGSSRYSPRNMYVAARLHAAGLGTLLFDLLTEGEESRRDNVFDIELLSARLLEVTAWLRAQPDLDGVRVGYFGASTGAAASLRAAASECAVAAVVCRGGRPDLAGTTALSAVPVPTLLIVGGDDHAVLELNQAAARHMKALHRLDVVPGATHLFEEPGALDAVARLAVDWFREHLAPGQRH